MKGPHPVLYRGPKGSNYTDFSYDARAAWQNALMWYITRKQSHWDRATTILDAWGSNLTDIIGTDTSLLVSLDGDLFVNAAEIMRWEGGWDDGSFSNQLYWLFARQSIIIGQANYGLASIKGLLSFAVYLDDVSMVSVRRMRAGDTVRISLYQTDTTCPQPVQLRPRSVPTRPLRRAPRKLRSDHRSGFRDRPRPGPRRHQSRVGGRGRARDAVPGLGGLLYHPGHRPAQGR